MAIYIKLGNIAGNVTAKGYEGWVEVDSFNFGVNRMISMETGNLANRENTRPHFSEVNFSKEMDIATTGFFENSLIGTQGEKLEVHFVNTGADKVVPYMTYTLEECLVSGYSVSGSAHGNPAENITIAFSKMEACYTDRESKNSNKSSPRVIYDLATASKG